MVVGEETGAEPLISSLFSTLTLRSPGMQQDAMGPRSCNVADPCSAVGNQPYLQEYLVTY